MNITANYRMGDTIERRRIMLMQTKMSMLDRDGVVLWRKGHNNTPPIWLRKDDRGFFHLTHTKDEPLHRIDPGPMPKNVIDMSAYRAARGK